MQERESWTVTVISDTASTTFWSESESVWITVKPLKCKTYLSTISLRVLESVGISETIVLQGVPVNNVLGGGVCTGICRNYSETLEVQGIPTDNVLVCFYRNL